MDSFEKSEPYEINTNQMDLKLSLIHPEELRYEIMPPSPPSYEEELIGEKIIEECKQVRINKGDGNMDYIKDRNSREMLENAWKAINLTETWDFVYQPTESFMMSRDDRIWIITRKMEELGYNGHSGFSFGWTMRNMQYLAKNGVEKFREGFN
jgi:hypothetical protein